jgi:flagellar biosynthesis component FlhA
MYCRPDQDGSVSTLERNAVALIISLTVIALSWVAYRPFLSGPCLSAMAGFVYYRIRNRQHQPSSAAVVAQAYAITDTDTEEHDLELQPTFKVQERELLQERVA